MPTTQEQFVQDTRDDLKILRFGQRFLLDRMSNDFATMNNQIRPGVLALAGTLGLALGFTACLAWRR